MREGADEGLGFAADLELGRNFGSALRTLGLSFAFATGALALSVALGCLSSGVPCLDCSSSWRRFLLDLDLPRGLSCLSRCLYRAISALVF